MLNQICHQWIKSIQMFWEQIISNLAVHAITNTNYSTKVHTVCVTCIYCIASLLSSYDLFAFIVEGCSTRKPQNMDKYFQPLNTTHKTTRQPRICLLMPCDKQLVTGRNELAWCIIFLIVRFWGQQDPGGPHVGPMNFVIWDGWYWYTTWGLFSQNKKYYGNTFYTYR